MNNLTKTFGTLLFAVILLSVFAPSAQALSIGVSFGNGIGNGFSAYYSNDNYRYNYGSYVNSILNYDRRPCANRNNLCGPSAAQVSQPVVVSTGTGLTPSGYAGTPVTNGISVAPRTCPAGTVLHERSNICVAQTASCPAGSVLNGTTCVFTQTTTTCPAGMGLHPRSGVCLPLY